MEIFNDYIIVVILGICLCSGYIIKNSLTMIDNKYIPLIMGVLGVVLSIINAMSTKNIISLDVILQGLVSGLASTGMHEMIRRR